MGSRYRCVLHTRKSSLSLSLLLRRSEGVYTQAVNRQHNKVGHLFQGPFTAMLVDPDPCSLELCRYVDMKACTHRRRGYCKCGYA